MCLCEGLCYEMEQLQSIPFADYSNSNGPLTRISSNPAFSKALASSWVLIQESRHGLEMAWPVASGIQYLGNHLRSIVGR
jgi:hypothetical protein